MNEDFTGGIARAMAVAGGFIIAAGLVLSGVLAGWRGLAGSFAGFAVASIHTVAALALLRWILRRPAGTIPILMMSTMWGRLLAVGAVLFGLTYVRALDSLAMLLSFLALFIAYTAIEVAYAYRAFGVILRSGR